MGEYTEQQGRQARVTDMKFLLVGRRKQCPYYPCHAEDGLEDCTFCLCPIYPCCIEKRGGRWFERPDGKLVWDCSDCTYNHREEFARRMVKLIRQVEGVGLQVAAMMKAEQKAQKWKETKN